MRDSAAIGREVVDLLDDPRKRAELQQRATEFGRSMAWPIVARRYMVCFEQARAGHDTRLRAGLAAKTLRKRRPELPEINLSHVRLMTDDTGMLQHATFDIPRYVDGYCIDDNARALLLTIHLEEAGTEPLPAIRALASRYLAFMSYAFDETTGRFRNFLTYERTWHIGPGSDDIWSLGAIVGRSADPVWPLTHPLI